jgi:RHS repeat-associated protein
MAKFLGKGYHANGFTPPACTGTMFGDVNCSGQFDAWIEEIGRDLVTSGCDAGGNNYCPANPIGEWEMLVFLAKGRHPATGPYVWTAYHPVPRGSIFTWRDENSRVATEAIGGGTPAAPQGYPTILIGRDNVYLGNMLVASYVTDSSYGTVGWQYYASDHLGTPRLVTTASAATIETRKYWPYGEEVTGQASTQYTRFAGMERDTAFSQYYDHARVQEFNLGRFLTPDLISGYPEEPKSWNRYSYVLGNPVLLVDPWGLCPGVCEDVEVNAPYIQVDPVAWPWVLGLISIGSGGVVTAPTAELSGDGTAGRSINERAPCTSGPSLQDISNFSAGFGDTVSLGLTSMVRSFTGANSAVDFASSSYRAGIAAGIAWHIAFQLAGFASGSEIAVGKNFRLAPWGNRTGNQYGRWPHYHRRAAPAPSGATPPGQGIGRHRPWETSPLDKCFGDRF